MAGYPKVYNIETDPHEHLVVGGLLVGHLARRSTRTEHHAVRWRLRRRLLALSGHGETAVKSPLLEGKADIGQPLLTARLGAGDARSGRPARICAAHHAAYL